jgi:hypothetical protein
MRKTIALLILLVLLGGIAAMPVSAGGWDWYYPYPPYTYTPAPDDYGPFYVSGPHAPGGAECGGSLATQLAPGDEGYIAERFSTLRYYPAGPAIQVVYAPAYFTVVAGPVCAGFGPLAWYYISYGGAEGWASESQLYSIWGNFRYWLLPVTS